MITYPSTHGVFESKIKEMGSIDSEYTRNQNHRKNLRVPLDQEIKNIVNKILNNYHLEKIWEKFTPNAIFPFVCIFSLM